MRRSIAQRSAFLTAIACSGLAGATHAAEILVTDHISTATTWTKNNTYNLTKTIYVLPGASLTIEAGTVVASTPSTGALDPPGALVVLRDADIFVEGTKLNPVIMTSTADVATWTGGNPKTGTWRATSAEWGNLTIMGNGFISNCAVVGNVSTCDADNEAVMEGLANDEVDPDLTGFNETLYGGGDDDDDSGSISYLSLRYGGFILTPNVELNGLSLGGVGRGTDIHHIDIMNNIDDGIEIWGGTVSIKFFNIWNIGDDTFDVDQGWRGKAQFGLMVQGYNRDVAGCQGSGFGDNLFETDGAEDESWQPVTTATIYNCTAIGLPTSGDHGTTWRDNARVQYRNCIFMNLGERLVGFDNTAGAGDPCTGGYGVGGTLSWADTWDTAWNGVIGCAPGAQASGRLAEITDSVFFSNLNGAAYTEATTQGVLDVGNNNVVAGSSPVTSLAREASVVLPACGLTSQNVSSLDPRAANDAVTSVGMAPADGFFTPAKYRGAFGPNDYWACAWTAADAFGFLVPPDASVALRTNPGNVPGSLSTTGGDPTLGNAGFAFVADNPTAGCGVTAGSFAVVFGSLAGPFLLPLPVLGCGGGPGAFLIDFTKLLQPATLVGVYSGAPTSLPFPIPSSASLCGIRTSHQVLFVTPLGATVLGNAADLLLGE